MSHWHDDEPCQYSLKECAAVTDIKIGDLVQHELLPNVRGIVTGITPCDIEPDCVCGKWLAVIEDYGAYYLHKLNLIYTVAQMKEAVFNGRWNLDRQVIERPQEVQNPSWYGGI